MDEKKVNGNEFQPENAGTNRYVIGEKYLL